jgi:hypothetical protein
LKGGANKKECKMIVKVKRKTSGVHAPMRVFNADRVEVDLNPRTTIDALLTIGRIVKVVRQGVKHNMRLDHARAKSGRPPLRMKSMPRLDPLLLIERLVKEVRQNMRNQASENARSNRK